MTIQDLRSFFQSAVPAYVNVMLGEDDMLKLDDSRNDSECYIKYKEGLDFSIQGVRRGKKFPTKVFSFKNQNELICICLPKVLELLDGVRRI